MKAIEQLIVNTAKSYVGQKEKKANSGFEDRIFELKMKKESGWQAGWAWCACFVELVWSEAYAKNIGFPEKHALIKQLITPSAVTTYNNFKAKGLVTDKPTPGALVVWRNGNGWTGHIGIVIEADILKKTFQAVEGNTNDQGGREGEVVAIKTRSLDFTHKKIGLNLLGFIPAI